MRVLDRNAEITTRYGGGFVQSIDGLEAEERVGRSSDWFFYVNGVESPVGAADYPLHGGEAIWWDYRDWSAAMRVPAVVGSWPQPFLGGYDGKRHPVAVECLGGGRGLRARCAQRLGTAAGRRAAAPGRRRRRARSGSWSGPGRGCARTPPRRRSRTARRRAASSPTSSAARGGAARS